MPHRRSFSSAVALFTFAAIPFAYMQTVGAAPPAKGGKGAASASASASAKASATEAPKPPPAPEPEPTPSATPDASAAATDTKPPAAEEDSKSHKKNDVEELPGKTYYFIGLHYRGTIIPKFLVNAFVKEGGTFFSNSVGIELDIRKDKFSLIPSLNYGDFSTGDTLFLQANKDANDPGNWSYVNSSLKSINAGIDLLWTVATPEPHVDIELGFGFAFGMVFGDLINNWVYATPNGQTPDFTSSDGRHFSKCKTVNDGVGCATVNHQNAQTAKVSPTGYVEPSWFNGGSAPPLYAHIAVPELSVRIKPVKQFAGRIGLGFEIPWGFFFGLSGAYGLEQPDKHTTSARRY